MQLAQARLLKVRKYNLYRSAESIKISADGKKWCTHRPTFSELTKAMKFSFDFKAISVRRSFFDITHGESVRKTLHKPCNRKTMSDVSAALRQQLSVDKFEFQAPTIVAASKALWLVDHHLAYPVAGTTQHNA